jgi:transposase InsO family protein
MQFHSNAATNLKQRVFIQQSQQPYRDLAQQFQVSLGTVYHWKHRDSPHDRSCRPHTIHYALPDQEEQMVLWLRRSGELSLDDLLEAAQKELPHLRRSSLHRLLVRHGCNRLPQKEQQDTGQPGTFKEYGPGYLHIDCFYLPKLEAQKHYCFVAIDRATRLVYLWVYEHKNKEAATDFLARCLEFYPFKIEKILTDNGREFTLATFKNRWGSTTKGQHPFEQLCQQHQIEHRQTKPYTPKTNGMVERTNGLIKENTTKQHTYQTVQQMKADLHRWFVHYNFYRRHRRIGRIAPYEAVCRCHDKQPELFLKEPAHLLSYRSQPGGT